MAVELISSKAPLFYYSFRQVRIKDSGNSEVNAANKVTIRKNHDFNSNGLEFLVYNCALSAHPELCEGIRFTSIDHDSSERVDFYGIGVSGNGIPLSNRMGVFLLKQGLPEVAFAKRNEKNIYWYFNYYSQYNPDVFAITPTSVREFIESTNANLSGQFYDPVNNTWFAIRAIVINYYSKLFSMSQSQMKVPTSTEWINKENVSNALNTCSLLKQLESICDEKAYNAYQDFRSGDTITFKKKMENMVSLLGTYYILYRTLV